MNVVRHAVQSEQAAVVILEDAPEVAVELGEIVSGQCRLPISGAEDHVLKNLGEAGHSNEIVRRDANYSHSGEPGAGARLAWWKPWQASWEIVQPAFGVAARALLSAGCASLHLRLLT